MLLSIFAVGSFQPYHAAAAVGTNQQISFQGKLVNTNDTNISNNTYNVEYKIYRDGNNTGVGSTLLWTEDYLVAGSTGMPSTGGVTLTNGTFNVNLGSICSFAGGTCGSKTNTGVDFNQDTLWLSIQVGNTSACTLLAGVTSFNSACGGDGEMTPFIRMTAVPQALNSDLLDGLSSAAFAQLAATQSFTGINTLAPTANNGIALTINGTSGTATSALSVIQGGAAGNIVTTNTAATSQSLLSVSQSTSAYVGTAFLMNIANGSGSFASGNFIDLQKNSVSQFKVDNAGAVTAGGDYTFLTGANRTIGVETQTAANTAGNNLTVTSATGVGTGAGGNITVQAGTSGAGATGNGGALSILGGNAGSTAGNGGGVTIDGGTLTGGGTNGTILLGTTNSRTITVGSSTGTTTVNINSGVNSTTPTISLQAAAAGFIALGTTNANTIQIGAVGSTANASVVNIANTTGAANQVVAIGATNNAGNTVTIQGGTGAGAVSLQVASTGTVAIGNNAVANTIQIGTTATNTGNTQAINIGNLAAAGTTNVTVGSFTGATAGSTTLQAFGTLALQVATAGTINVGNNGLAKTIQIGQTTAAVTDTIGIGNSAFAGSVSNITIGNLLGASTTTINAGTGNLNLSTNSATASVIVKNSTASTTAFEIQNAVGAPIFNVDTTSTAADGTVSNYLSYSGFETGSFANASAGWIKVGAVGASIAQNTTKIHAYNGITSVQVNTTAAAGDGLSTSSFVSAPPTATTYIVSFYAKVSTGTMASTLFTVQSTDGATRTCSPAAGITINSSGFQRLFCQFTATTGAMTALQITQNDATARTIYIDSVQLQSTTFNGGAITAPTPYEIGGIQLRGIIQNPVAIMSSSDSTTALQVFNAAGNTSILNVDTLNKVVQIGSGTADAVQVLLQPDSFSTFADTATCSTTVNQGAIYYNTAGNVMRGCLNGAWEDLVSTAGLGLQLFGVVPDTGANPGDLAGVTDGTAFRNGPCKVSVGASTTTVSWTACTAYSGGRKVLVTASTAAATATNGNFQHLCLTGTGNQPALSTSGTEVANLVTVSMPSVTNPILCLADIKTSGSAITQIYDTRTYTTTDKETISVGTTAPALGHLVQYTATRGTVIPTATLNGNNLAGVIVATTGATSTTTINAIIAVSGPAAVKAITGTNLVNAYIFGTATAGYASTVATKPAEATSTIYNLIGAARTAWSGGTACAINSDVCAGSILTSIDKR